MPQAPTSQIIWPKTALAGCIFCAIVRDTRGAGLGHADRFNFFPASPLCCVTGIIAGDLHRIDGADHSDRPWSGERLSKVSFSGAQVGPVASWSPGDVYVIVVAFYPDAFAAMSGLDLGPYSNRMLPADHIIPEAVLRPCKDFFDSAQHEGAELGFARLQQQLETVWSAVRPQDNRPTQWLNDWTRTLVTRATFSAPGKSARQVARRIRAWTGVNHRELKSLGQTEQLYANIHEAMKTGDRDWVALATASGFADQAHMIRRLRQHTGFTPEQLRQLSSSSEALWGYRLLGQYFSKPNGEH